MIKIINTGKPAGCTSDILGLYNYELWVNDGLICEYQHKRGDGLGMCLLAASKAVEKKKFEDAIKILGEVSI